MTVTPSGGDPHYIASMDLAAEEGKMTTVKQSGSRVARWVRQFTQKNKTPYRWYEVGHSGL